MDSATTEVFRFSASTIGAVFLGGAIALAAGIWLIRNNGNRRLGSFLIIMSAVAEVLLGPGLVKTYIAISPRDYASQCGFWFAPNAHQFAFKDVSSIRDGFWIDSKRRRVSQWDVHLNDGSVMHVPKGDLWRANEDRIVQLLRERGVRFE
jgi:hypothetical protein